MMRQIHIVLAISLVAACTESPEGDPQAASGGGVEMPDAASSTPESKDDAATPTQDECSEKEDCNGDLVCVSGQCVLPQCTVDEECADNLTCVDFRCRFLGERDGGTPMEVDAEAIPQQGSELDAGMPPADSGAPTIDAGVEQLDATLEMPADATPDANPFNFDSSIGQPDMATPMGGSPMVEGGGSSASGGHMAPIGGAMPLAGQPATGGSNQSVGGRQALPSGGSAMGGEPASTMGGVPVAGQAVPSPECFVNFECQINQLCRENVCVARCNMPGAQACDAGLVCDEDVGECVAALACPPCAVGLECDEVRGSCVAATPDVVPCDGDCPGGFTCHEASDTCQIDDCTEDRYAGNDEAVNSANVAIAITDDLSLCTEADWYQIVVPPSATGDDLSLKITAAFAPVGTDLELALYDDDFVANQRPRAEGQTGNNPEILIADGLEPGPYLLEVSQFVANGRDSRAITYALDIDVTDRGFCSIHADCDDGLICVDGKCEVDPDPCMGACGPLEICDAATLQCLAQCNADIYAGANTTRQTAQSINAGTLENLTICTGEDDWYQIQIDAPTTLKVTVAGQGDPIQNDIQLELWSIDQDFDVVNDESPPPEPLRRSAIRGVLNEEVEYRFDAATTALIRVFALEQASYTMTTSLGAACVWSWDCCAPGELNCYRQCVEGRCAQGVCGEDFTCVAPEVCNAARTGCGRPECVEDVYRGDNVDQANAIRVPAGGNLDGMSTCNRAEDWYSVALGAGDGIRLTLDFIDDGFASYDLQFLNASERLHQSISAFNQEFLEYNVDTAGEYFIRVYGALEGQYDLRVESVPGGIDPIECSQDRPCGTYRICQPSLIPICVEETCAGAEANVQCADGFVCNDNTGACECENPDQFSQLNDSVQTAAVIQPGFAGNLTLCGSESETDWFAIDVAQFETLTFRLTTDHDDGLRVSVLDAQSAIIGDYRIFGNDRIELGTQNNPAYIEIRSGGEPRPIEYRLEFEAE